MISVVDNDSAVSQQIENSVDDVLNLAKSLDYGELHFTHDNESGLFAIVAIHSTKLGPALGGCRCIPYTSAYQAYRDAMRLAQAMSYKAAISNLPLGGGKAVLIKPTVIKDRRRYFESFGKFVNNLNGRYITAMDSGTTEEDMNYIASQTKFVASQSQADGMSGNPSPATALGVKIGIDACVKHKLKRNDLTGLRVAIQGVGNVGYELAKLLHSAGAKLIISDINKQNIERCVADTGAEVVAEDAIHKIDCDIFAPCALGATLNDITIPQIKASIIAGCANNQLQKLKNGQDLVNKNILYAPDYVINAGGLVYAASIYLRYTKQQVEEKVKAIYDRLLEIFARADTEKMPTNMVADLIARELIK